MFCENVLQAQFLIFLQMKQITQPFHLLILYFFRKKFNINTNQFYKNKKIKLWFCLISIIFQINYILIVIVT